MPLDDWRWKFQNYDFDAVTKKSIGKISYTCLDIPFNIGGRYNVKRYYQNETKQINA